MYDANNRNVGITEGAVEMIKEDVMRDLYGEMYDESIVPSTYGKETLLAKQISLLVGKEEFEECFFSGEGIQPLKDRVKAYYEGYGNPDEIVDSLFEKIEDQYCLRQNESEPEFTSTITADIQCVLLDGIDVKISRDIETGKLKTEEELTEAIKEYESCLLTPANLNLKLEEEGRFPSLKEQVTAKLNSVRQRLKERVTQEQQKNEKVEEYDLPGDSEVIKKEEEDFGER